jgi:O-antigen/teichoic acid export membrane protein
MEIPLDSPTLTGPAGAATTEQGGSDRHFRTDHLLGDLRKRAVSGTLVTVAAQASKFALNFISAIVLARLLMPEDFGLVAMVTTVTAFLRVFKDAGLSTATIQKAQITHAQVSNLFWINVGVSAALSLIVAALAPVVAWFYRDPRLVAVTLALASTFAVSGAVVQHQALLNRQLRFKAVAVIDISSAILGLLVGITMARLNFRYWSLVGMQLSMGLVELVLTLCISGWRPQRPTRGTGTLSLLQFGASLTVASILQRIASASDNLFIGRWYGANAVGLYTRAAILFMRPIDQLICPLEAVFTPILSRLQHDPARYRRTFLQVYGAVVLLSFPLAGLFLALSRPVVLVVLGPKWEQVIPIFSWFTIATLYFPLYYAVMWLLNTQGRGKDIVITSLILSITTVGSVLVGLPFGPVGVAAAFSCFGLLLRLPVQFYIVGRRGPVSTVDLWAVALKYLPNWAVVLGVTYLTRQVLPSNCPLVAQLCICASAGILAGVVLILAVPWQRKEVLRLWDLIKPLIPGMRASR